MKTRLGFTLIELLVTISIVMILLAIIVPAFVHRSSMRPSYNTPRCYMVQPGGLTRDSPCPSY